MFKWIFAIFVFYGFVGWGFWYFSDAKPISEQIDLKTMSFTDPSFIVKQYSICQGDCTDRSSSSSSSSSWGRGGGGK